MKAFLTTRGAVERMFVQLCRFDVVHEGTHAVYLLVSSEDDCFHVNVHVNDVKGFFLRKKKIKLVCWTSKIHTSPVRPECKQEL